MDTVHCLTFRRDGQRRQASQTTKTQMARVGVDTARRVDRRCRREEGLEDGALQIVVGTEADSVAEEDTAQHHRCNHETIRFRWLIFVCSFRLVFSLFCVFFSFLLPLIGFLIFHCFRVYRVDFPSLFFPEPLLCYPLVYPVGMAEIHDQFDTILILDFGSQVRYTFGYAGRPILAFGCAVQPFNHSEVSRTQCICGAHAMYSED
jgi:hypothetical protein